MNTPVRLLPVALLLALLLAPVAYAEDDEPVFIQSELEQMLAPIALYPDSVLSQVLIASTYPLEIVEAARWSRNNPGLDGADAVAAVDDQDWDPSVKALVAFPDLLARMSEDLDWTTRLGDAVLSQEEDVLDTIQNLRERAYAEGQLDAMEHVTVRREQEIIVIEPAHPRVVHVPYYNPTIVYGSWLWPAYPPVYWGPPRHYYSHGGFFWGSGVRVSVGFFFSSFDWRRRHVTIVNVHKHPHFKHSRRSFVRHKHGLRWRHDPKHRRGVAYRSPRVERKFRSSRSTARHGAAEKPRSRGEVSRPGRQFSSRDGRSGSRGTARTQRRHSAESLHNRLRSDFRGRRDSARESRHSAGTSRDSRRTGERSRIGSERQDSRARSQRGLTSRRDTAGAPRSGIRERTGQSQDRRSGTSRSLSPRRDAARSAPRQIDRGRRSGGMHMNRQGGHSATTDRSPPRSGHARSSGPRRDSAAGRSSGRQADRGRSSGGSRATRSGGRSASAGGGSNRAPRAGNRHGGRAEARSAAPSGRFGGGHGGQRGRSAR